MQGISLGVRQGQIVAVLGTNGAGKTTTLRAISGFLGIDDARGTYGSVVFKGQRIENRGMGWLAIHNTVWFLNDRLNRFVGAEPILHREIQPVIICNLNQEHPITKGIEPFIINLDEQFGVFINDPENVTTLFKSQSVHDKHRTIQGWSVERGKGRIVGLGPGHYEWTWYQVQWQEIMWRSALWAMHQQMKPFYGSLDAFIW